MTRQKMIEAYAEWLANYDWKWFVTLTFRGYPSSSKAGRLFARWISEIQHGDGATDFRWFRVCERGAFNDHLHFHVLVGGLRTGRVFPWVRRWQAFGRTIQVKRFNPDGKAIFYLLKELDPAKDFDIDFEL